jgi:hypothetical protein
VLARQASRPAADLANEPRASDLAIWREANSESSISQGRRHARGALADPVEVLEARAWARARLWSTFDIDDLHEAVDVLQAYAVQSGLVDRIGQDGVQAVIGGAFRAVRTC